MHRKLSVLIAFVLVTPSFALTDASKTELAKLVEAVRTESAGMQGDRENQRYVQGFIRELERHAGSESSVQLDQTLSQYAGYFRTKEVADAITSLQTRLTEERKQADDLYARNLETLLKKASDAVSTAKEPADLDEIITQLGKVDRNEYRAYNQSGIVPENIQRLLAVVSPARSFVEKWQDYLAAMKSNDFRAARLVLKTLVQGERGDPGFVPRSEILAKLQELSGTRERAVKIIAGINTLEEIGDKVALLQSFSTEYDGSGPGIHDLIAALVPINKSYRDFLGGMPVMVDVDNQSYAQLPKDVAAKVMDLRKMLLILVLPRYVGAPEGTKAAPDETVAAFLDRIAAEAKAREDGALGLRIKELRRILTRTYSYGTQDNRGMDAYVSGQNQETAGEMALAVISYQQALKSGSELVPAKRIGERLEAIKKSHPAEYEKGVEKFLNLSVSPNLQGGERPAPKQ